MKQRCEIRKFALACSSVLLVLMALPALAWQVNDDLTVNGFVTLDATSSDVAGIVLPSAPRHPRPLERNEVSYDNSLLGIQLDFAATENLSFSAQGVATRQNDGAYGGRLEWLYLSYDFGHDLHLRLGKFKLPFLQGTELRHVGYSRLWARPVMPSNGAGGFDDYKGAELIKNIFFDDFNLRLQGAYGRSDHEKDFVDNDDIKLISARAEFDDSWVSLALVQAGYDVYNRDSTILIKGDAEINMVSLETEFRLASFIINAGYADGDAEVNPDERLAYLSVGYQFDRLTPYVLVSERVMTFDPLPGLTLPPPGAPLVRNGKQEFTTEALGLRYELGDRYAIKLQWDQHHIEDATNAVAGVMKSDANIYSIVFEGVF